MNARRHLLVLLVAALAVTSCSTSGTRSLEFGIRRIALDIAFVDEDASPPVEPEIIIKLIPAPPVVYEPDFDFSTIEADPELPPLPPIEPFELCPTAEPDATVLLPASPSVLDPVAPGKYPRDNSGFIEITGAGIPLRLPYPFLTLWTVSEAQEVERPGLLGTPSPGPQRQFSVTKSIGPGFETVETFELGAEALLLVERTIRANGAETVFRPEPAIQFFKFGAEGDSWNSAGVDTESNFAMVIQAEIVDREIIDVCGDLIDTFRIDYTEAVVNLETGETSGTDADEPSVINLAPQYGGLVVREEIHSTQRTSLPDGTPIVIQYDYISTLSSIDPGTGL